MFGNPVVRDVTTDENGYYLFDNLYSGTYRVIETQPEGFDDGLEQNGSIASSVPGEDQFNSITLTPGDAGESFNFGEVLPAEESFADLPGATGNPPRLPGFLPPNFTQIGGLFTGFLGSPGPIYSGVPINSNADPLSLDSGRAVTGGYAPDSDNTGDCACECECECSPEPVDPCSEIVECDPCSESIITQPVEQVVDEACGCDDVVSPDQCPVEDAVIEAPTVEAPIESECEPCTETLGIPTGLSKPSFLKRFTNWLSPFSRG